MVESLVRRGVAEANMSQVTVKVQDSPRLGERYRLERTAYGVIAGKVGLLQKQG